MSLLFKIAHGEGGGFSDIFDFYKVGVAALAGGGAAGDDDAVAGGEVEILLGKAGGHVKEDVGGVILLGEGRADAPGQAQLAPALFVGGDAENVHRAAEA